MRLSQDVREPMKHHDTSRQINIAGIENHELTGLDVVTAASLLDMNQGKVIGLFNEYAF